ncbi:TPA: hypothetical protein OC362_003731 [Escherichia coli]|nr:Uncharacterised protein [Escherichia coli]HCP2609528.1 hypothetical protein [Escherichia coli]HCP2662300.1 hypothetical protein [Escherichia coli]HCP2672893.1 hypothetical protein [Escherichia coli]HCP2678643.1 hypothetical protein [Escherichia coli]
MTTSNNDNSQQSKPTQAEQSMADYESSIMLEVPFGGLDYMTESVKEPELDNFKQKNKLRVVPVDPPLGGFFVFRSLSNGHIRPDS